MAWYVCFYVLNVLNVVYVSQWRVPGRRSWVAMACTAWLGSCEFESRWRVTFLVLGRGLHSHPPLEAGNFSPALLFPCSPTTQLQLSDLFGKICVISWSANAARQVEHTAQKNKERENDRKPCCDLQLPKNRYDLFLFAVIDVEMCCVYCVYSGAILIGIMTVIFLFWQVTRLKASQSVIKRHYGLQLPLRDG